MLISLLPDVNGSRCILTFDESGQWLRATWCGFISMEEAMLGSGRYLHALAEVHCPYLLNDNTALLGPWFDSIEWLEQVWVPQAMQLGLRYVAHVVQADSLSDCITVNFRGPKAGLPELQIFQQVADAEAWLRSCQRKVAKTENTSAG